MKSPMSSKVLIVGAGPVGMGAALELARFGIPSLVIEKESSTSWHPKTRNFNTRSMEITRGWGRVAYERLCNINAPNGWKTPIRFGYSATGEQYSKIDSEGFQGPSDKISPCTTSLTSQDYIEEIMLDAVKATGLIELRFNTEATRLVKGSEPDATEAVLEIRNVETGAVETVTGEALVSADGAGSLIRRELKLEMEGASDVAPLVNCYFRADIEKHLTKDQQGILLFVDNEVGSGVLQPLDIKGRWLCQINVTEDEWSKDVFTKERAKEWIVAASGVKDLDVEVYSLGFWKINAKVADRLVSGRVVMCGDAAHQFPPSGGIGVNTGLQGMHNVMWKLAYCLTGKAGWDLLKTYHTERRDVAKEVAEQCLQNAVNVSLIFEAARNGSDNGMTPDDVAREARRYGNHLGIEFGAYYESSAIISDGTKAPEVDDVYSDYIQSASPGARAPHFWLGEKAEKSLSSIDMIRENFVLLAAPQATGWETQAKAVSGKFGLNIDAYRMGRPGLEDRGQFTSLYEVGEEGAVLIRPDGYIAWRSVNAPSNDEELETALRQVVSL